MLGVMREIFSRDEGLIREEVDFFSVARTIPFVAEGVMELASEIDVYFGGGESTFDT